MFGFKARKRDVDFFIWYDVYKECWIGAYRSGSRSSRTHRRTLAGHERSVWAVRDLGAEGHNHTAKSYYEFRRSSIVNGIPLQEYELYENERDVIAALKDAYLSDISEDEPGGLNVAILRESDNDDWYKVWVIPSSRAYACYADYCTSYGKINPRYVWGDKSHLFNAKYPQFRRTRAFANMTIPL